MGLGTRYLLGRKVVAGQDRTGARPYFWVAYPTMRPTIEPGIMISQKYRLPVVGSTLRAIGRASSAATRTPNTMLAVRSLTFREMNPISSPASNPLPVDPATIVMISGFTSGADRSAVRPSSAPSTPPRTRPSTGLFTRYLRVERTLRPPVTRATGFL